jgi:hypothetical protein
MLPSGLKFEISSKTRVARIKAGYKVLKKNPGQLGWPGSLSEGFRHPKASLTSKLQGIRSLR